MKLSIIIPCYNERQTIADLVAAVKRAPIASKEIIIVDDGSTGGTQETLKSLRENEVVVLFHNKNQGKGAALRTGFQSASGDICIVQDADLEYDPQELLIVIGPIVDGKADVVFGSRFQGGRPHRVVYFWHRMGNGFLTLLSNIFSDLNLSDMETCYKAFRREVIQSINLKENRFGFEPEVTAKVSRKQGIRIYEVGISYYGRTYEGERKSAGKMELEPFTAFSSIIYGQNSKLFYMLTSAGSGRVPLACPADHRYRKSALANLSQRPTEATIRPWRHASQPLFS